jgi:hypothetical protein
MAFVLDRHAHAGVGNSVFAISALRCAVWAATGLLIGFAARPAKNVLTRIASRFNKIALFTPVRTPATIIATRMKSSLKIRY